MSWKRLRILHVPVDLGGHAATLAAAQRALGHDAQAIALERSPFGFDGDECWDPAPDATLRTARRELARVRLLLRSLRADVVHCHFGRTVLSARPFPIRDPARGWSPAEIARVAYARALWLKDLALWRRNGSVVAMTFYGDDIRSVAASLARNPFTHLACERIAEPLIPREGWKARLAAAVDRDVEVVYAANPDLLTVLPERTRLLPYPHAGAEAAPPTGGAPVLRLLHLPTDRAVKGTQHFAAAVEALQSEGAAVSLTIAEGLGRLEVQEAIRSHDVVLDQLRVGWYGAVAVEAMAIGRPVIAYLNPDDMRLAPAGLAAELPVIGATPDTVLAVLREMAARPRGELAALGARSRQFVRDWHDAARVAAGVIEDYGRAFAARKSLPPLMAQAR